MTFAVLSSLFEIKSVKRLHLSKLSSEVGLFQLVSSLSKMPNLQILRLRNLNITVAEDLKVVPGAFGKLTTLQLWDQSMLSDAHIGALLPHFAHVKILSLRGHTKLSTAGSKRKRR